MMSAEYSRMGDVREQWDWTVTIRDARDANRGRATRHQRQWEFARGVT